MKKNPQLLKWSTYLWNNYRWIMSQHRESFLRLQDVRSFFLQSRRRSRLLSIKLVQIKFPHSLFWKLQDKSF